MNQTIYKIFTPEQWQTALQDGQFSGAPVDLSDGYIHFSTKEQVCETAAKHFRDAGDLVLVSFPADAFGSDLKWEPSRGGALFPHLYAQLDPGLAHTILDLKQNPDGTHHFPEQF